MPAATALVSDGLKVHYKGSDTAVCNASKTCAGFCARAKDSATGHAFCLMVGTSADVKVVMVNATHGMTVAKADFEKQDSSIAVGFGAHAAAKFAFVDKAYEGEGNWEIAAIAALHLLKHDTTTAYARYTHWVPKAAVTDAAGVPPKFNAGVKATMMCLAGNVTPDASNPKIIPATGSADIVLTGTAVVAGGPANSWAAGDGRVVLTRPAAFAQAATAISATANIPLSIYDPDVATSAGNCQGSWLEVAALTKAAWATAIAANTDLAAYSSGLKMTVRIRLQRNSTNGTLK